MKVKCGRYGMLGLSHTYSVDKLGKYTTRPMNGTPKAGRYLGQYVVVSVVVYMAAGGV